MDERGLCPLIYAAGYANPALFSSLLTRTDLSSVFSILEENRTTLLQVIVEAPLASGSALERTHSVQTPVDKDASLASLGEEDHGTMYHEDAEGERGCGTIDAPRTSTVDQEDEGEREHGACRSIEISLTSAVNQEDDKHYGTVDAPSSTRGSTVDSDSLQCLESLQAYDRLALHPSSPPIYYVGGHSISLIPRLLYSIGMRPPAGIVMGVTGRNEALGIRVVTKDKRIQLATKISARKSNNIRT